MATRQHRSRAHSTPSTRKRRCTRSVTPASSDKERNTNPGTNTLTRPKAVANHRDDLINKDQVYPLPPLPVPTSEEGNRKRDQSSYRGNKNIARTTASSYNNRSRMLSSSSSGTSRTSSGGELSDSNDGSSFSTETEERSMRDNHRSGSNSVSNSDDLSICNRDDSSVSCGSTGSHTNSPERRHEEAVCHTTSPERRHEEAVRREEHRVLQRNLYNENRGFEFNVDTFNAIKRVLKEKIFPKIKILSGREQAYLTPDFVGDPVDQSRLICDKLIHELDMSNYLEEKIRFWITYRKLVKNQLVKYRSNSVEDLKREYFKVKELLESEGTNNNAKEKAYLEGAKELMSMLSDASEHEAPLISLRNDDGKNLAFFFFAREFLPCIVKRLHFRQNKFECPLSEFVTVSDEAFTLLVLENNVARWNAMFSEGTNKAYDNMPPQKYCLVKDDDHGSGHGGKDGYSTQATKRYNHYFDLIEGQRKDAKAITQEYDLMNRMEALELGKRYSNKKTKRKRDGELNHQDETGAPLVVRFDSL